VAEMGAPPACGGIHKHPNLRRVGRLCVWSLVIAAVVIVVVNLTVARLPTMPRAEGKYISLRGKEIHYVEQPGHGVPIVLLHGQPGTFKDFEKVTPELPGLHLISIDRPGYGWSRGGWLPYQDEIDLVHELLAQLKLAPAILVGQSFGGSLALGVARRYPQDVAKMILVAPAAGGTRSTTQDLLQARFILFSHWPVVRTVIDVTVGDVIKRVSATAAATNAFAPEPVDPVYERRLLSVNMTPGNLDALAYEELEFDDISRWLDENVAQIRVPSVIIGALGDQLVAIDDVRRLADQLAGSELITVDGNHMITYTHPDVVAAQIRQAATRAVR
jgi:pimeloyl-ACP methyl ester carboxylesterase